MRLHLDEALVLLAKSGGSGPAGKPVKRTRRALACRQFKVARAEQQKREHRDRVEIDRAGAGHGGPGAGRESRTDAQRDGRIHAGAQAPQFAPRAGKEGAAGKRDDRRGEQEARPAHQVLRLARQCSGALVHVGREGIHHHLHRAEAGDEQPPQGLAPRVAIERGLAPRIVGIGVVTDRANGRHDVRQAAARRIPGNTCALARVVEFGSQHAGHAAQRLLVKPEAGRAADAVQDQGGAALIRPIRLRELLLCERIVVGERVGRQRVGLRARLLPGLVVPCMAGGGNGACNRLATRAAEFARCAQHRCKPSPGFQGWKPAVETGRCHFTRKWKFDWSCGLRL